MLSLVRARLGEVGDAEKCFKEETVKRSEKKRLHGQVVKTPPFHGGNTGSNPVGVIIECIRVLSQICRCGSIGRAADL